MSATGGGPPKKESPNPGRRGRFSKQTSQVGYHGGLKGQPQEVLDVLASMPPVLGSMRELRWLLRAFHVLACYYPPEEAVEILEEAVVRRRDTEMENFFRFR